MGVFLLYLAGASFFLFVTPASILVLLNEHSPWPQALEAAALLLWTVNSALLVTGTGLLKIAELLRGRMQKSRCL